jgi:hypothetical protein
VLSFGVGMGLDETILYPLSFSSHFGQRVLAHAKSARARTVITERKRRNGMIEGRVLVSGGNGKVKT